MLSDPIADMLTRIRNAIMAGHASVAVPHSQVKMAVAEILKEEGYIEDVSVGDETPVKMIHIKLKYWGKRRERRPVITNLKRVSKPGRRVYVSKDEIPWVMSGMGISILTTPKGVMTGQSARRQGIGGEVICYVW
jgi:small subunit ribosomal protein S8